MPRLTRRTRLTRPLAAATLVLAAAMLVACSDSGSDRLTVYSGRTSNLISPLLEQFSEETGIALDVRYDDSANLALLIDEEGDRTPADVFISQSPGAEGFLDEAGRLGTLDESVLGLVDESNRSDDGSWVGLSGRVRVLVYNTDEVDEADLPDSVLDLSAPEYEGRVAVAPTNGSFQDFVTAMRSELGDDTTTEWLDGMADNGSPTYANNNAIVEAVGRGEGPMGLVNHYYNERALAEDPDQPSANHFFPDGDIGSLLLETAVSVIDGTDQRDDAQQLVEFLLSEQAQTFFAEETFEYPLAAGVEPVDAFVPLSELSLARVDLDELGGGLERTTELIEQSGLAAG
ncbi:iron ABC transporter substrate-binding protein [soil metagenome]